MGFGGHSSPCSIVVAQLDTGSGIWEFGQANAGVTP